MAKHRELLSSGVNSFVCWGCGRNADGANNEFKYGYKGSLTVDRILTTIDGRAGFHSLIPTLRLLHFLDKKNPDVVHLHNLHGYHVNIPMLFNWLACHDCKVKWTLHDCWAFTGHCAYSKSCPQLNTYPETISGSRSCRWCYEKKKYYFTLLPQNRVELITPSVWLKDLVKQSFLAKYKTSVISNPINKRVFFPRVSNLRTELGVGNKLFILGAASNWTERKGLSEFIRLSEELDPTRFAIVLVGLSDRQILSLPDSIIGLPLCESASKLAEFYSAADVFVHPGVEETFGLTVAEAQACGTKVIVVEGSACAEIADPHLSIVVSGTHSSILNAIKGLKSISKTS